MSRKDVLLRAAFDLLQRSSRMHLVEGACSINAHYDGADCDGFCLMEDIARELGIDSDQDPIPLDEEEV
jgi:hypothetical protein